ncbi:MAG: hypothetical protein US49_C0001G0129 [candidate division TM6 bacterium GW2011_GWF2_37_49]|nr:MAG: hypothetical protein US49_C0001G0129 [candidate division TM6 bacterium GW2011_GWF2_37_49]
MKSKIIHKKNVARLILGLILFTIIFCCFAFTLNQTWFREDDLGTLINGRVKDWTSAVRVFFSDCRSFITPCNYQRTVPNFISALWRPLQNYIFSLILYIFGPWPMAFYFLQVAFHAANAFFLFILYSLFVPLGLAFFGGLLFAFYPDISWMIWASTLQNSLSVFFIILMMLCLSLLIRLHKNIRFNLFDPLYLLACGCYFFSLLSRESGIFLPAWLCFGVFIYLKMTEKLNFLSNAWQSIKICWVFFVANIVYFLLRIWAFGFGTLDRTLANLFLRFPFLNKIFAPMQNIVNQTAYQVSNVPISTPFATASTHSNIFWTLWQKSILWIQAVFNISLQTQVHQIYATIAVLALIFFVAFAFKRQSLLLLWLMLGLGSLLWPSVLTYPSARYINAAYPIVVFIFIYSIYLFYKTNKNIIGRLFCGMFYFAAIILAGRGLRSNMHELDGFAHERVEYKKRFDRFFARYKFKPDTNFVLICSPYVSDIESIFQFYLNNYSVRLVFDPFSTVAESGVMGCNKNYQTVGVKSDIAKIPGGFRLISNDEQHCGWWLRHSNFNVAWCAKERAYRWTNKPYIPGVWYECSIGHFMINKMANSDCITDISFVYDSRWIDENTVFVAWDTQHGEYFVVA